jgi:Fe-S cluster assembly protein SufD
MSTPQSNLAGKWSETIRAIEPAPGPEWLQPLRRKAADEFDRTGLPNRKTEAWKYTPMRVLESLEPEITGAAGPAEFPEAVLPEAPRLDIADGSVPMNLPELPAGLAVLSLRQGFERFGERLRPLMESENLAGATRAFSAMNTALLEQGLVIHAAAGVDAGSLLLRWAFSEGVRSRLAHFRIFLLLEAGSRLHVVDQFQSKAAGAHALNLVVQAELGEAAELRHSRIQLESADSVILTASSVEQAAKSRYEYRGFDLGAALARHELGARLAGEGAHADIGGAFVLGGKRYADNHVNVEHAAVNCSSDQFFRGVLGGRSRGVFNGRALIEPGADGSSVKQSNANLLLSPLAEMDTKPELEIYADEVEASHGATVGQLDETAIFYLRTRGLDEEQARRMLTAAFCQAVTDRVANRELADRIAPLVDEAMSRMLTDDEAN